MNEISPLAPLPSHVDPTRVVDFDMFNIPLVEDQYQLGVIAFQREGVPEIFWTRRNGGHWVFTRTADIHYALNTPEDFSSVKAYVPVEKNPDVGFPPMMMDPPLHRKYRALLAPTFSPKNIAALAERARARCVEITEALYLTGACEFIRAFAMNMPIDVFAGMVDLPPGDREMLLRMGDIHVRPASAEQHMNNAREMREYARKFIDSRRGGSGEDLITKLTRAQVDGEPVGEEVLASMVVLVLLAGLDTVASTLGFFACFFAKNPERQRELIDHPERIPTAVDESLRRFSTPTVGRMVARDFSYKGVEMRTGEMLILPMAFANMDPDVHDRPLEVDFTRPHFEQGVFGFGAHHCIGANLARQEIKIFLEEFLPRIRNFRLKPGTNPRPITGTVSGFRKLEIEWDVA